MTYQTGLVVGKFCPLHKGHQYLIDTAISLCARVIVISYTNPSFDGYERAVRQSWLNALYPTVKSLVVDEAWLASFQEQKPYETMPHDDDPEDNHRKFTAWLCHSVLGEVVDAVFTSEDYGDGFAKVLTYWFQEFAGTNHLVTHVCVDKARENVPVSGTMIRSDPWRHADMLDGVVRASFVKKILILGGESTGKTTLCANLARHLGTEWVAEYGRKLWEEKDGNLVYADMLMIAQEQIAREDAAMHTANHWLICDTSPLTTAFYSEAMFGIIDPQLSALADRRYDHILLCMPDIAFVQDGTRRDAAFRDRQHEWYCRTLDKMKVPYSLISGAYSTRLEKALEQIDANIAPLSWQE